MESHQLHLISTYRDMCFSRSWRSEVPIHSVETINAIQPSNPFIAAHGATGIRVEGDSGNDTLFGKSMEKPNSKSKSNVWLVFQISCDDITSLNLANVIQTCSNFFHLVSCFKYLLTPQCLRLLQCWLCRWHLKNSSNMLPQPNRHFKIHFKCEVSSTSFCLSQLRL